MLILVKKIYKMLDGYSKISDGYAENIFAHHENATAQDKEDEYFMQWVYPLKLNRIALRTPVGHKVTYMYSKDFWNNRLGIKIENDKDKTESINKTLTKYLMSRNWFKEMYKFTAFEKEQGEAILLKYFNDEGNVDNYINPVKKNAEILKVEAFNPIDYHIPAFDKYGQPLLYRISVKSPDESMGIMTVDVHPSRVIRKVADNIEYRFTGYSDLAVVYDAIIILSTILKAAGEAAYRWGTGHPTIFTRDLFHEAELIKLKNAIGDFTRRSWHMIPSEYVERIDLLGQAGSMLNLKSLADIAIDQIVIGTGIPRPILLGEVAGVVSGSEVNERGYFALLDRDHTEFEKFIRKYFEEDVNIRKILNGIKFYEIDWGIREVLNRTDEVEIKQKEISNLIALMQFCTVDEVRALYGLKPLGDENYGDVVIGLEPFYMAEIQIQMMALQMEQQAEMAAKEPQGATNYKESGKSTQKKATSTKGDLEKNKRITPKMGDGYSQLKKIFDSMRNEDSINTMAEKLDISSKTIYKIINNLEILKNNKKG